MCYCHSLSFINAPLLLLAVALVSLFGCGTRSYPVQGKVIWQDGTPAKELARGLVIFEKTDEPFSARGEIQADGTFQLGLRSASDGTPPGKYRVLIVESIPDDSDAVPPPKMNRKFGSFETSGLEFTVEPKNNQPIFTVERTPKRKAKQ